MIWFSFACVVFLILGILVCVKHDAPEHYEYIRRLFLGLMLALFIAISAAKLYAIEISPQTCNSVEKYSLLWYYPLMCFLYEQSS